MRLEHFSPLTSKLQQIHLRVSNISKMIRSQHRQRAIAHAFHQLADLHRDLGPNLFENVFGIVIQEFVYHIACEKKDKDTSVNKFIYFLSDLDP